MMRRSEALIPLEDVLAEALAARGELFVDSTSDHNALDFFLPKRNVYIETKEKRQPFAMRNWPEAPMSQEQLFIIDDLAVRKLLFRAPHSFCLVRDSSAESVAYHVYSIVDFLCVPRIRCRRPIKRTVSGFKGKWLIDFRDAASFGTIEASITYILAYTRKHKEIFSRYLDCWGKYPSEVLRTAGSVRTSRYWNVDSNARGRTRSSPTTRKG